MEVNKPTQSKFRPLPRPCDGASLSLGYLVEVVDLYNELLHEYRELDRRTTEREKRYRGLKKSLRDWDEYFKRKRQAAGPGHGHEQEPVTPRLPETSPLADGMTTPRARAMDGTSTHEPHFPSRLRSITHAAAEPPHDSFRPSSGRAESSTTRITSSQSTEGAFSSSQLRPHEEDDSPVIVSTRSLKRKRASVCRDNVQRDAFARPGTPDRSLHVKEESHSSPITTHLVHPHLLRNETSDLDVFNARNSAHNLDSRSENAPPDLKHENRHDVNGSHELDHASTNERQPAAIASTVLRENETARAGEVIDASTVPQTSATSQKKTTPERASSGPLHSLSTNTPVLPRTSAVEMENTKSSRKPGDRGAAALHVLSEDGSGELGSSSKRQRISTHEGTPKSSSARRLDTLLEGTAVTPARPIISPRVKSTARKSREQGELQPDVSFDRPAAQSRRAVRDRVSPQRSALVYDDDDPGPARPEHEPLRSRPLHRLNIDDFKINPENNDQRGYAYNETVRKKQERRYLPGCTKDCCKAIRQLAAAGVLPPPAPHKRGGLFDDDDDSGGEDLGDDELTLQGYLGRGYAQIIHNATPAEKAKMLVDARAQAFANQHGKHRQAFERRNTPPGFWRTDMPSTQEEQEDREQARCMERQKVEERWREAMKGGGKYLFRDE